MKKSRLIIGMAIVCLSLVLVSAVYADTTYVIQPGDTLTGIAIKFNISVASIVAANGITNPNIIYAGTTLVIPDGSAPPPPTDPGPEPPPATGGAYVIQFGDTLSIIAAKFGTTVPAPQAKTLQF